MAEEVRETFRVEMRLIVDLSLGFDPFSAHLLVSGL